MKALPTPRRLLHALMPLPRHAPPPAERREPVLGLAPLLGQREETAPAPDWAALERALDAGSRRIYQPRGEAEVIEKPRC